MMTAAEYPAITEGPKYLIQRTLRENKEVFWNRPKRKNKILYNTKWVNLRVIWENTWNWPSDRISLLQRTGELSHVSIVIIS